MIHSIKFEKAKLDAYKNGAANYYDFKKVQLVKDHSEIKFKKGLNVIMGDNGYGKSALLSLITTMLFVNTSRMSELNETELNHIKANPVFRFVDMVHDGQPCYFLNTNEAVGLKNGQFTNDNFSEAIDNIFNNQRQSNGQSTLTDINIMFEKIINNDLSRSGFSMIDSAKLLIDKMHSEDSFNYDEQLHTSDNIAITKNYIDNIIDTGQKTIIIDEFEKGLSIENTINIINALSMIADKRDIQIIIASQSPLLAKLYFDRDENGNRKTNFIGDKAFIAKQMSQMLALSLDIAEKFNARKKS